MKNKKILIVEDELIIAAVLKMQLQKNGHEVENVTKGKEVLDKIESFKPDCFILDIFLKDGDNGIDIARKLRDMNINTPIIFTTGNSLETTTSEIKDIPNCKVLIKPVDFTQLNEMLNN